MSGLRRRARAAASGLDPEGTAFLLLISGIMTVSAMTTDINLPALPEIARRLEAPIERAQLTVTLFFAGFAFGQLFVGPLSDRFGRRPVLLWGLFAYTFVSLACALADDMETLLALRTLQGVVAAAGPVLARAVVRDLFTGSRMARTLSLATAAFILAPIVAPSLGALLLLLGSFRFVFLFLALYGLVLWLASLRLLGETLSTPDRGALRPARLLASWTAVFAHPRSRIYGTIAVLNFVVLLVYLTNAPVVFMQGFGLSPGGFGLVFAVIAMASAAGSLVNARLLRHFALERLIALATVTGAGFCILGVALLLAGGARLGNLIAVFAGAFFSFSSLMSNATAAAMQPHGQMAGAVSSVLGALQTVIPAAVASFTALLFDGSALSTLLTMALAFAAALALALGGARARVPEPGGP